MCNRSQIWTLELCVSSTMTRSANKHCCSLKLFKHKWSEATNLKLVMKRLLKSKLTVYSDIYNAKLML